MRARDEASAKIKALGTTVQATGGQFRQAIPSLATFGASMASLLITTGALNSETGKYVTLAFSIGAAAASAIPSIILLVNLFKQLALAQRAAAIAQAVLLGLSGIGLPLIAAGVGAGLLVAGGIAAANRASQGGQRPTPPSITIINQGVGNMSVEDAERIQRSIREQERFGS